MTRRDGVNGKARRQCRSSTECGRRYVRYPTDGGDNGHEEKEKEKVAPARHRLLFWQEFFAGAFELNVTQSAQ